MSRYNGIRPVTNGLVFCIDPTNRQSYTSGSTIVYDLANTTTGATLFNGPTFSTGSTSNFITFDGTNDYFSSSYVHTQSDHTVIAIVKLSTLNDDWIPIIEFSTTGGTPWRAHYYVQGLTNTFNAPYSYRGFGANFFNGSSIANDQWYSPVLYETNANEWMMLTGRVSGTTIGDTFVNKIKSRPTTACTYSNQSIISIANSRPSVSFYYGGNLGLVLYYNRALTDNEIIQTYNAYQNRFNLPGDIVTNGLVLNLDTAYYNSYPRTGTTWSDLSGSGNNGTLTNGPTYVVTGASSSIQFDGVDDYISTSTSSGLTQAGNTQFTVSFWVIKTASNKDAMIGPWNESDRKGWFLQWFTDSVVYFGITNGGANYNYVNIGYTNNWYNIVGVFDGSQSTNQNIGKIYVNGVLQTTNNSVTMLTSVPTNLVELTIGKLTNYTSFTTGNISSTQIYNRALSESEIQQNFNALRGRFGI